MAAYFCCWEPYLALDPQRDGDADRFQALLAENQPATPTVLAFANFLLACYPDNPAGENTEVVWSQPLKYGISGSVISCIVRWRMYDEMRMFIRPAARMHGLDYFDPQANLYIPAEMKN